MKNFVEILQGLSLSPHDRMSRDEYLESAQNFYLLRWKEIEEKHRQGFSGRSILKQLCESADVLIEGSIFYSINETGLGKNFLEKVTLCALGGYGREELSPYSDLDLCLLHSEDVNLKDIEEFIQIFTTILWDIGLQVGISVYTVPEAIKLIEEDPKTFTSYLHIREIIGNSLLYDVMKSELGKIPENVKAKIFELILQRLNESFLQSGRDLFSSEPDIKESAGGLRDYHATLWVVGLENRPAKNLDDIQKSNYIENSDYLVLSDSLDFLWKIRNELHFTKGKAWDLLTFEMQYHISQVFNYKDSAEEAIERFMQDFYSATRQIRWLFEYIVRRVEQKKYVHGVYELSTSGLDEKSNYVIYNRYLTPKIDDSNWFVENPVRIMELFWEVSRRKIPLGYTFQDWIQKYLYLINDSFRSNEVVTKYFLAICSTPLSAGFTFREMEKLGVLSQYLPEFGAVQGIIRYKNFHSYPVNEHIIRAVEALEKIPHLEGTIGDVLRKTLKEIEQPEYLILSILLHDLGKVEGESHIEAGVQIARTICSRMGLSDDDIEHVAFLVENHQLMIDVALNRDIDDIEIIQAFLSVVNNEKYIKELLIMSYADLCAVGPNVWNEWKGSLLIRLFLKTLAVINQISVQDYSQEEYFIKRIEQIVEKSPNINRDELEYHLNSMGSGYLDAFSPEEVIIHIGCVYEAQREKLAIRCWSNDSIGMSHFVIATRDKRGLFSQIAGCFASQLIDIYSASLYTREDNWVVDCFLVRDAVQQRPLTAGQILAIEKTLRSVILNGKDVQVLVDKTRTKLFALKKSTAPLRTYIRFDNKSSAFHTVIDIETTDRTGLLYDIASAFSIMGMDIFIARINTGAYRVRDSFYVQFQGAKITHRILQTAIRAGLLESIDSSTTKQE